MATLFTIGFTQKSARRFFETLKGAGVSRLIDVRLNNVSQLAGFAKRDDLAFFLGEICGCGYTHAPELAPTKAMLDGYKTKSLDWAGYERGYVALLAERGVERRFSVESLDGACLLCSEATPERCHRRLAAEHLARFSGGLSIKHL